MLFGELSGQKSLTKNGQNMSSRPFSHDAAHNYDSIHVIRNKLPEAQMFVIGLILQTFHRLELRH